MADKAAKTNHLDKNLIRLRNNTFAANYVQYIVKLL